MMPKLLPAQIGLRTDQHTIHNCSIPHKKNRNTAILLPILLVVMLATIGCPNPAVPSYEKISWPTVQWTPKCMWYPHPTGSPTAS